VQGDHLRVPRLIFLAPDVHACDLTRRQPAGDSRQHRASSAPHIEYPLVTAEVEAIQNALPFNELAAPGRVEKADKIRQKEDKVESE
jgi:hypothetical protein